MAKKHYKNAFEIYGFEELAAQFAAVGKAANPAAERAVYKGGGVMADVIRQNIVNLPEDAFGHNKYQSGVSKAQKLALLRGLGIAPIGKVNGIINVRVGFDGYMEGYPTKTYPGGMPIPMLANAVESGSQWRAGHGFVRKAVTSSRQKALQAMSDEFDKEIKKVTGGK